MRFLNLFSSKISNWKLEIGVLKTSYLLIPITLYLLPLTSSAQLTISIETEGGVGWWIAHHEQPGLEDKSLLNLQLSTGIRLGYMLGQNWEVGFSGNRDNILGYYLRNASDRVGARDRTSLSEGNSFQVNRFGLYAIAWPIQSSSFRMGGGVGLGVFTENSTHPQKALFKNKHWWQVKIPMSWEFANKLHFELGANYLIQSMGVEGFLRSDQKHILDRFGGYVGLRMML